MNLNIRPIKPHDNVAIKSLVTTVLLEHGIQGQGFAGVDPELDDMFAAYQSEDAGYFVIESEDEILGVGGFAVLAGTAGQGIAELRKMYFKSALRGRGWGNRLLSLCIQEAKKAGFKRMYLETTSEMKIAQALYIKHGFVYRTQRLGATGHSGCGVFMERYLL